MQFNLNLNVNSVSSSRVLDAQDGVVNKPIKNSYPLGLYVCIMGQKYFYQENYSAVNKIRESRCHQFKSKCGLHPLPV